MLVEFIRAVDRQFGSTDGEVSRVDGITVFVEHFRSEQLPVCVLTARPERPHATQGVSICGLHRTTSWSNDRQKP